MIWLDEYLGNAEENENISAFEYEDTDSDTLCFGIEVDEDE